MSDDITDDAAASGVLNVKLTTSRSRKAKRTEVKGESRRIVMPPKTQVGEITDAMVIPHLDGLLNDSLVIIGTELSSYRRKVKNGSRLELKEARAVQGYMETLIKLSKESRDQARFQDLSDLTDEQLIEVYTEQLKHEKKEDESK